MKISTKGQYYGNLNSELECKGALLTRYNYDGERTPWHYHENPYFMFVLDGNMIDGNKKGKNLLPAGSLMFTNWQEVHYGAKHSDKASGFHLELERNWFEQYDIEPSDIEGSLHLENPIVKTLMTKIFLEFNKNDMQSRLSIEALIVDMIETMKKSGCALSSKKPVWTHKVQELIMDSEIDYSLSSLGEELNIHPVHLSREFHRYFGSTFGQYIRRLKLQKAINLMSTKKYSLTEVCYQCGFYDQSHFISNFKSVYQMTPSKFMQSIS